MLLVFDQKTRRYTKRILKDVNFQILTTPLKMHESSDLPAECDRNHVIFSNLITCSNFRWEAGVWNFPSIKRRDDPNCILPQKYGNEN